MINKKLVTGMMLIFINYFLKKNLVEKNKMKKDSEIYHAINNGKNSVLCCDKKRGAMQEVAKLVGKVSIKRNKILLCVRENGEWTHYNSE